MIKLMKDKYFKNYILLVVVIFSSELIFKGVNKMSVFDWTTLRIFISTNIIALILSMLFSLGNSIIQKIGVIVLTFFTTGYAIIQSGFNNFLGLYISIGTSSQAGAVKDYIKDYLESFKTEFYLILIPFILLIVYYIFIDKKFKIEKIENSEQKIIVRKQNRIKCAIITGVILVLSGLYISTLTLKFMQNEIQIEDTKDVFKYPEKPNLAVNLFGTNMYLVIDIRSTIFHTSESTHTEIFKKPVQEITDYTRVFDDTLWEELAAGEKNAKYAQLHNYYMTREITPRNDYTGMFSGKNLIVVMMESVNDLLLYPEYFPNFNKIYSEGWSFENNYSPRNSCSTANNEMSGMTSLFTVLSTCTANTYKNNVYPQSIFNLFNMIGYKTTSYHDFDETYYYRKTIHPNMGVSSYYDARALGIKLRSEYEEWPSDVELITNASKIFLNDRESDQPFLSWLVTVSPHQPYGIDSVLSNVYKDYFDQTDHPKSLKRYLSKLKVMDDSIGELLRILEENGELEDTVIVAYADHYPYGLTQNTINDALPYDVSQNLEIDKTPFVIYNASMTGQKFSEYTTYMNILPTIANLFDLDYDPRLYAGQDLFSETYDNRAIFADGSWQSELGFYDATNGKISYNSDIHYTSEEIKEINKIINNKIKMSNLAITSNYFNYLYTKLGINDIKGITHVSKPKETENNVEEEKPKVS